MQDAGDAGVGGRKNAQDYWARCTLNFPPRVEGDSPGPLPGSCTRGLHKDSVWGRLNRDPQVNTPRIARGFNRAHGVALSRVEPSSGCTEGH